MSKRKTTEEFIQDAVKIHGNRYDYSLIDYKGAAKKVIIICPIHGQFLQEPRNHLRGSKTGCGCQKCGIMSKQEKCKQLLLDNPNFLKQDLTYKTDAFIKRCSEKHNNYYDYSLTIFTGTYNPIKLICPIHGEFEKLAKNHLAGYGCNVCGNERRKQTNLEKYGHENIAHGTKKEKIQQIFSEKYGGHPQTNPLIREKAKQTCFERYGTFFVNQSHLINILPQLTDFDWLYEQYIIKQKSSNVIADELGIQHGTVLNYLHNYEIELRYEFTHSAICISWLESVMNEEQIYIQHSVNEGEFNIPGTRYKVDGFCKETNTVYEFHGDYWHGNPNKYTPEHINTTINCTMGELYQKTLKREQHIRDLGYNLIVKWESDFI